MQKSFNLCLNYHDFSGPWSSGSKSNYTIDFDKFKIQLSELKNIRNIDLADLLSSDKPNENSYSLTFDDGLKSNLYIAEELAKQELIGTFFIIKDKCLSNNRFLSKNEIRSLVDLGMKIGSHSCTHRHLNRLPRIELIRELQESKFFLEDITGKPINVIAFPGGQCGKREFELSRKVGYLLNRTTISGLNYTPLKNDIIKCINVKNEMNNETFKQIIGLSPMFFAKAKLREWLLSFPKYLESSYESMTKY